jgi:hypothetical protein
MRRFKSAGHAQRFLSTHGAIINLSRHDRYLMSARSYRALRNVGFAEWKQSELEAMAKEMAKHINSQEDLGQFTSQLMKTNDDFIREPMPQRFLVLPQSQHVKELVISIIWRMLLLEAGAKVILIWHLS